jgi:hypothetical protein
LACALVLGPLMLIGPAMANIFAPLGILFLLALPVWAIGALAGLTDPHPNQKYQPEGLSARRVIRWSLLLVPMALVLLILVALLATSSGRAAASFSWRPVRPPRSSLCGC